ncbi:MAG: ion transporter [Methanococcaceae archaeon]
MNNSPQVEKERYRLLKQIEDWLEVPTVFLGFVWLALLIIEFIQGLSPLLNFLAYFIWGIFILEFSIRFLLAPHKFIFLRKNIITLLALIVPALRIFRIFQALNILKVARAARGIRLFNVLSSINRGLRSLRKVFGRRGFGYVVTLSIIITFASAAAMYGLESGNQGFTTYSDSLWWTSMMMTTVGSQYWPITPEGRILAFLISLYAFAIFGYIAAALASFFIEREADSKDSQVAGQKQINKILEEIRQLRQEIHNKQQ